MTFGTVAIQVPANGMEGDLYLRINRRSARSLSNPHSCPIRQDLFPRTCSDRKTGSDAETSPLAIRPFASRTRYVKSVGAGVPERSQTPRHLR